MDDNHRFGSEHTYLRLKDIIAPHGPIPVSRSQWWKKVREGEYPPGKKISARITAWPRSDVEALLNKFARENHHD